MAAESTGSIALRLSQTPAKILQGVLGFGACTLGRDDRRVMLTRWYGTTTGTVRLSLTLLNDALPAPRFGACKGSQRF